jgi:hypothetical protein
VRTISPMLASKEVDDALEQWRTLSPGVRECLVIIAALVAVCIAVLIWVVYFRRVRRRPHGHHHSRHYSQGPATDVVVESEDEPDQPRRRKWRRPRREHRPRNPTLSETGGLPPVRTGGPPEILP